MTPGVRDNRSTLNTKTGYDDDDDSYMQLQQCGYRNSYHVKAFKIAY